jgi:hypothetical protein
MYLACVGVSLDYSTLLPKVIYTSSYLTGAEMWASAGAKCSEVN